MSVEVNEPHHPLVTASDLDRMLSEIVTQELGGWRRPDLLVRTSGSLRGLNAKTDAFDPQMRKRDSARVFAANLDDNNGGTIVFNALLKNVRDFRDGDTVEVIGYPVANVYQGKLTFRLEVQSMRFADLQRQVEQRRREVSTLSYLRGLKVKRNIFPLLTSPKIALIHSSATTALVDQDFLEGLKDVRSQCEVTHVPVKITSAEAIASAVRDCTADILVIVRGGGGDAEFTVFNEKTVLDALAASSSYRVLGIGHTAHKTLADLLCDFSASTPQGAGTHIRDQMHAMFDALDELKGDLADKEDKLDELQRALDEAKKRADAVERAALQNQQPTSVVTRSTAYRETKLFAAGVVIGIALLILLIVLLRML